MDRKLHNYILIRLSLLVLLLYIFAFVAYKASADDYADVSLGMFSNSKPSLANVKFGQIGHREYWALGFFNQYEGGGWVQVNNGDARKSSAYVSDQVGLEAENVAVVRVAVGPAIISTPDSYLGGIFQFHETLFLGLKGTNGNTIGFSYQHFSSAGLETPNVGRDFGGIEATVPF